jgi:hypothetical protein
MRLPTATAALWFGIDPARSDHEEKLLTQPEVLE